MGKDDTIDTQALLKEMLGMFEQNGLVERNSAGEYLLTPSGSAVLAQFGIDEEKICKKSGK
jgi:hypothetical protein